MISNVKQYFIEKNVYIAPKQLNYYADLMVSDMIAGLNLQPSSLKMIPSYIEFNKTKLNNEFKSIVFDAGGTNLRTGIFSYYGTDYNLEVTNKTIMPGVLNEVTKETFFNKIIEISKDILNETDIIGFCFSYPVELTEQHDGKLISMSKELKITNLLNEKICDNFRYYLKKRGFNRNYKMVLLNDTVATLFSGMYNNTSYNKNSFLGFILGTGTNISYLEKNGNIKKLNHSKYNSNKLHAINIESGAFDKGPLTYFDNLLDSKLKIQGDHLNEKMISGKYLGKLIYIVLKDINNKNFLHENITEPLNHIADFDTVDISLLYANHTEKLSQQFKKFYHALSEDNRKIFHFIIKTFIKRAEKITAFNLAAVIKKIGNYHNNTFIITIDGSTYWKIKDFHKNTKSFLSDILGDNINFNINHVENASLLGAGIAAQLSY